MWFVHVAVDSNHFIEEAMEVTLRSKRQVSILITSIYNLFDIVLSYKIGSELFASS